MSKVAAGDATHVYAAGNSGIHFYNGAAWSTPAGTANDYYGDVAVIPGTPTHGGGQRGCEGRKAANVIASVVSQHGAFQVLDPRRPRHTRDVNTRWTNIEQHSTIAIGNEHRLSLTDVEHHDARACHIHG